MSVNLGSLDLNVKSEVRDFVIKDADLSFVPHTKNAARVAYYHLRNISKVRSFLTQGCTEKLVHAFVTSRYNYCNFSGIPLKDYKYFIIVMTQTKRKTYITPVLKALHWLPGF